MKRRLRRVIPFLLPSLLVVAVSFGIYGLGVAVWRYWPRRMPLAICEGRYCHGLSIPGVSLLALTPPRAEFPIVGHPNQGPPLTVWADGRDTFGSFVECEDLVHGANKLTGKAPLDADVGFCEIPPHSLHAGLTKRLMRKYPDVYMAVAPSR